ncbi:hypothetical protein ISF_00059 [Cordyceps fumosorosea ARSEF 2679]|uniref:Uncharacterized protein n=1 Tax=Cordyceps fumosorosea (strain ARSEF 2679) TaxID=1081104 RepID=A0A168DYJ1_CORFA|nr:hypothetical protein ISF_00059 [Cordyceps fumosorosea ARSEF 2679]OAA73158.1 hypothetical protein ISF_00059 [Cordyceps fumosorosea ARSEF 2679]
MQLPAGHAHQGQGGPSWARQHDHLRGVTCVLDRVGFYGRRGATTEPSAYGSVLHNVVTGAELYDEIDHLEKPTSFCCLAGGFSLLAELAAEVAATLKGAVEAVAAETEFDEEHMERQRTRCKALLEGKLADIVLHAEAESAT